MPKNLSSTKSSILTLPNFIIFLILSFLTISSFNQALFNGGTEVFFQAPIYGAFVFSSVLLFFTGLYLFNRFEFQNIDHFVSVLLWLIPISYMISYVSTVTTYNAGNSVFIQISYIIFFISALFIAKQPSHKSVLMNGVLCIGVLLIIFGFMNWFGDASLWGLVQYSNSGGGQLYKDAVMVTDAGVRLTSVFQYANTYAAMMIGLYVAVLILLVHSSRLLSIAVYSSLLVPILLSLVLTLSRGGYIVLPIILLLSLPLLNFTKQILFFIYGVISVTFTLIVVSPINTIGVEALQNVSSSQILKGWSFLILSSLMVAGISIAFHKFMATWIINKVSKFENGVFVNRFLLFLSLILFSSLLLILLLGTNLSSMLPGQLGDRIANINLQQHSVLERGTFYTDAMKIISDYFWFGTGGGGWSAIYEMYQNNPYTSRQAHNFVLQYFVETGIVGLLTFLLLLGYILYKFLSRHFRQNDINNTSLAAFMFFVTLGVHSLIDFNMSYVFVGIVFFILLGIVTSEIQGTLFRTKQLKFNRTYSVSLIILSIVLLVLTMQKLSANNLYHQAVNLANSGGSFNTIEDNLNSAIRKEPHNTFYRLQLASYYLSAHEQTDQEFYLQQAQAQIDSVAEYDPYNKRLYSYQYHILNLKNRTSDLLNVTTKAISKFPWDITLYENVISLHYTLGLNAKNAGDTELMRQHWSQIRRWVEEINQKVDHLNTLPEGQLQGRPFEITDSISEIIKKIQSE